MIGAALEMLLRESDYELLGRARSAAEARKQISAMKPDLLLLDVHLPDGSGLDIHRRLLRARARPRVILLTAGMDESQLLAAADLKPEGMVLKTSDPGLLLECMDAVAAGESLGRPGDSPAHAPRRGARGLGAAADAPRA